MPADQSTEFTRRLFVSESYRRIAQCEPAIFWKNHPRTKTSHLTEDKKGAERYCGYERRARTI
jgi:hypothetical protein